MKNIIQSHHHLLITVTIILAIVVRILPIIRYDFPLNDGGMFYTMTQDLLEHHFRLPSVTTYNQLSIPYSYPPLGFYLAAVIHQLTHVDLIFIFRWLPVLISLATIPAFYWLSRLLLPSSSVAILATIIYGLLPASFESQIMGGGLTRGLGLLFAILAFRYLIISLRETSTKYQLLAIPFTSLTLLSHPEAVLFLLYSTVLLFFLTPHKLRNLKRLLIIWIIIMFLTSPWWFTVIRFHGFSPFLTVFHAGGGVLAGIYMLISGDIEMEPLLDILSVLGVLGLFYALSQRQLFLPLWIAAICLFNARSAERFVALPITLSSATIISEIILPALKKYSLVFITWLIIYAGISALSLPWIADSPVQSLSISDRQAMEWISQHTDADSNWIVMPAAPRDLWSRDRLLEWFPSLTHRHSLATVQGTEWLPDQFYTRIARYRQLKTCNDQTYECLDHWASRAHVSYTYIYIPHTQSSCCALLEYSLRNSPHYQIIYDQPDVFIAQRVASK